MEQNYWTRNKQGKAEVDEFFAGLRRLWFVMRQPPEYEKPCHIVIKMEDGPVIPCWLSEEAGQRATLKVAEITREKGFVLKDLSFGDFAESISEYKSEPGVPVISRLHLM